MVEAYTWKAPAYHHHEKNPAWYVWSMVVAIILGALAIFQGNVLFLIFIIIGEALLLYRGKREPVMFEYTITSEGIEERRSEHSPEQFLAFSDYMAYALYHDPFTPHYAEVIFKPKKKYGMYKKILMPSDGLDEMKELLAPKLYEFHYEEPLSDHLVKRFKL